MTVHLDKVELYTGPEPICWLKPVVAGPPENGPLETVDESSPQVRSPDVRPKRARRPPGYLAGYEWKNQTTPNDVVRTD